MRKKRLIFDVILISFLMFLCGCSTYHYCIGKTIRPGTSFKTVHTLMGKPNIGLGLPQKNTEEMSWLYYKIPFDKYLVVNFKGYYVDNPPTSIEDRFAVIE